MDSSDTLYVVENILYTLLDIGILVLTTFLLINLFKYKRPSLTKSIVFEIIFFVAILGVAGNIVLVVNDIEIYNTIELTMALVSIINYALCIIMTIIAIITNVKYTKWIGKSNNDEKNTNNK